MGKHSLWHHEPENSLDIPEGDEACRVIAIAAPVTAAFKGAAANAQVEVAPQDGVGCGPVMVHVDVLQAGCVCRWAAEGSRAITGGVTFHASVCCVCCAPVECPAAQRRHTQHHIAPLFTLPVPLTNAVECS